MTLWWPGQDVFVHISALEAAGLRGLDDGAAVQYDVVVGKNGKSAADNIKLVS